jgi:hypothetical protein
LQGAKVDEDIIDTDSIDSSVEENIIDTDSIDSSVVEINQGINTNNNIEINDDATRNGGTDIEISMERNDNANNIMESTENNLISTDMTTLDDVLRSSGMRVDGHNLSRSENEVPLDPPNAVNFQDSPHPTRSRVAPSRWGYATRGGK